MEQREGREAPNITLVRQKVTRNDLSLVPSKPPAPSDTLQRAAGRKGWISTISAPV